MSNEADLDWLARNVHHWAHDHARTISYSTEFGAERYGDGLPYPKYTKDQWLARRAELQNKPSLASLPAMVRWIAQGCTGTWSFHTTEPESRNGSWFGGGCGYAGTGEVLGDWRDTLEQRPVDLSESAVTERLTEATQNVLAAVPGLMGEQYKFEHNTKPVAVSNETVQLEQPISATGTGNRSATESAFLIGRVIDMLRTSADHFSADELAELNELTGAELTKRDAAVCGGQEYLDEHWFERGELPPVGVWCEAHCDGAEPEKCKILAYHKQQVAVQWSKFNQGCLDVLDIPGWTFRPVRTERDALIEIIKKTDDTDDKIADAILAAGFSRRGK